MAIQRERRKERRGGTRKIVKNLLAERQEMLVAYCRLAGLEPYHPDKPVKTQLEEFCQLLMDYTAFGHFELYGRIADGGERRVRVLEVANQVFPDIAAVTDEAVAFNDKYDASEHALKMDALPVDLSRLGEKLALRLEQEDRFIGALLDGVGDAVA